MDEDQFSKDGAALLAFLAPIVVLLLGIGCLLLWLTQ